MTKTKVLYVGYYRDGTGWAHSSINHILALDSVGVDVVPRAIKLNQHEPELPERLLELEQKSSSGADVVIQNLLPHHMEYWGNFRKNIGMFLTETSNFRSSVWGYHANLMDQVWVNSTASKQACLPSGVKKPIKVVPCAFDIPKYEHLQQTLEPLDFPETRDRFVFYSISELTARKNVEALLRAYYTEFKQNENVVLLLKTHLPGQPPEVSAKAITQLQEHVAKSLKLYANLQYYPEVVVITANLSEEEIFRLHLAGNCYVSASRGEGWNIPLFEGMCVGNPGISPNDGAPIDYIAKHNGKGTCGWLVDGAYLPCYGGTDTFADIYTGWEKWMDVNVLELQRSMRECHSMYIREKDKWNKLREKCQERASRYDYKVVGQQMKELLEI